MIYVIVHGAWHTGEHFSELADFIRASGHVVHTPTIKGNAPGDNRRSGLKEAVQSIVDYVEKHALVDIVLAGHSYGGMVITGVADAIPHRIHRLVYWNAFVPNHGESVTDLSPPHYAQAFDAIAAASPDNSVALPYPLWRDAFINDADEALAKKTHETLNAHPYATLTDKIELKSNPATWPMGKSYINCTEDTAMPHSFPWHPRMSQKLGLFRLVQCPGSHELCFTDPKLLAEKMIEAGRD